MSILKKIRKSYITKGLALCLALNFIAELVYPSIAYGLTSGPIDINQTSFEPASTSEMVNLVTGDFTYNIPLMDVDGYPINIAYHGGVSMEQEASIVGLGWSLNVGAMNRMKRGLPDDFSGDKIETEINLRPQRTQGGTVGVGYETVGYEADFDLSTDVVDGDFSLGMGISFNNYRGYSVDFSGDASMSIGKSGSFANVGLGIGFESSSSNGMSITPHAAVSANLAGVVVPKAGIGFPMNTTEGLKNVNLSLGLGLVDKDGANIGLNRSTSIAISSITFTPAISFERNVSISNFNFDLGFESLWKTKHLRGGFFASLSCLTDNYQTSLAYGYLYEDRISQNSNYLMDINRDGVIIPSKDIVNLPITNHTFDVYSATAQGVAFSSRPFRSDILTVSEPYKFDNIGGIALSGEASIGNLFQVGVNTSNSSGFVRSGSWSNDNKAKEAEFIPNDSPSSLYEPFYFKKFGNRSGANTSFYNDLGQDHPLSQQLTKNGVRHIGEKTFDKGAIVDGGASTIEFSGADHYRNSRDIRNTSIQYLDAEEATEYGFDQIKSHTVNNFTYTEGTFSSTTIPRYGSGTEDAKKHHLSEMTVLKGDGSRYLYGLPVVNRKTEEVVFNVSNYYASGLGTPLSSDCQQGLINYDSLIDNSLENRRGDNNLFLKKSIPASANSHLLTAYLSSNYIDRTQDGPTPDDYGGYTKFNYSKMSTELKPTRWRFPFELGKAAYNEGLKSNEYDNMASYVYGEREEWLLHSIESKNFVAVFQYDNRHDAYGVANENGGIASYNNSRLLKTIKLYTREGLINGEDPIKEVHFEYDYSLCPDVPNNDGLEELVNGSDINAEGGKLTLKAIYFTYGQSNRGKLHKYRFDYSEKNPAYSLGKIDRWGSFKDINVGSSCDADDPLTNFEFPYSTQNKSFADENSQAWMLSKISLPSGSDIEIVTESDDYSYVMEKEASQMFMVRGMSEGGESNVESYLYDEDGDKNYIHIALDQDLGSDLLAAKTMFKEEYVGDIEEIYFKFLVSVSGKDQIGLVTENFEYVSGYAEIDRNDIYVTDEIGDDGIYDTGLIRLKSVHIKDKEKEPSGGNGISPISKASWQFIRKYLPGAIYPMVGDIYIDEDSRPYGYGCGPVFSEIPEELDPEDPSPGEETDGGGFIDMYNVGVSQLRNILSLGGVNFMMKNQKFASNFVPEKSWVRLYQGADNKKLGGGHRVKQITVNDNWSEVKTAENLSIYGTKYTYSNFEDGLEISSGVASYEPITSGSDENTYRHPVKYSIDVVFRVNDEEFQETPIGESIFATSQVAYSKVEVKNIDYENVTKNSTGKTVYKFYTARDFPSFSESTQPANLNKIQTKNPWLSLITGSNHNYLSTTQGYSIQINDMHGKFKEKTVIANSMSSEEDEFVNNIIYSMKHIYYTDSEHDNILSNEMDVVSSDGTVSTKFIGKDIDMVLDLHETQSFNSNTTVQFGLDVTNPIPPPGVPVPVFIPSFWMSFSEQDNRYRSSVTTKVIYSNGILKEIILNDKGRVKRTQNLLFDKNTGVPIVTKILHETPSMDLEKPIYQFDYPAYWMYKGMGLASENWGATFTDIVDSDSKITLASFTDFLNPGDEIAVSEIDADESSFVGKYWVLEDETTGNYYLIDEFGDKSGHVDIGFTYEYKVIRSGKRNLLSSTAASVTSLNYDVNAYTSGFLHSGVLNSSAVEYTERAFGYEGDKLGENEEPSDVYQDMCGLVAGQNANPYVQGLRANWNLLASYVFDGERDQTSSRIREDGTLEDYIAFWKNIAGQWGINTDSEVADKWIRAAVATIFDQEGYNLESQNALGIYSSILLGYNNTLKVAEAVNARYYEIGYDGFEDRDYDLTEDCKKPHFRFVNAGVIVDDPSIAHTGRHSLKVMPLEDVFAQSEIANDIDHTTTNHNVPYVIQSQELISQHTFLIDEMIDKRFVLTAWVKEEVGSSEVISYYGAQISVIPSATNVIERRSNIIDGWQRVEIEFTIPGEVIASESFEKIRLKNLSEGNTVYFDDIRIQPFNSEMVSYVIDPVTLRLWATLDSRNFATYYQYDEEGSLVRISQETERGIITVKENRAGIRIE